jgi:hypothetical protein
MLTREQIRHLFSFCEKHFVKYYDVQVELVDHLANAIEAEMQADRKTTFERALEKVYRSFGVMGFASVVAEKQRMTEKQSRKLFFRLFKEQFKWPKILTFFLLAAVMFSLFSSGYFLIKWVLGGIIIVSWPIFLFSMLRLQRLINKSGKKFLAINFSWVSSFILMPTYLINFSGLFKETSFLNANLNIEICCISIFLSLYIIAIIAIWQTLSSLKNTLYKNYPEVFSLGK